MKLLHNERGSALVLVLFLVVLIGLLTPPLLMSMQQGLRNSAKGEGAEKANYTAESGTAVFRRALYEAVKTQHLSMDLDKANLLVERVKALNIHVNGQQPALDPVEPWETGFKQTTTGTAVASAGPVTKGITIYFKVAPGTTGSGGSVGSGIFGADVVAPTVDLRRFTKSATGNEPISTLTTMPKLEHEQQLEQYLQQQFAIKPAALTADTPFVPYSVVLNGTTVTADRNGQSLPAYTTAGTSGYHFKNNPYKGSKVINDNVVYGGDIYFDDGYDSLVINGDLVATGNIVFSNWIGEITVNGRIIAGGEVIFNGGSNKVTVTKEISSRGNTSIKANDLLSVGAVLSGGTLNFNSSVTKLTVSDVLSSQGNMTFSTLNTATVGSGILSGGHLTFNSSIELLTIPSGNISARGNVSFSQVNGLYVSNGSIIAEGALTFNSFKNVNVNGSMSGVLNVSITGNTGSLKLTGAGNIISSEGNVTFSAIEQASITGSIAAKNNVSFTSNITGMTMKGTVYSSNFSLSSVNNLKIEGSVYVLNQVQMNGHLTNLTIGGSYLAKGPMTFPSFSTLKVGGFVGSEDTINFPGWISSQAVFGGITTPKALAGLDKSGYDYGPPVIQIIYNPPGAPSTPAQDPVLEFTDWRSG